MSHSRPRSAWLIFAFILALPVILYELYGFLLPAFSPEQQKITSSLMLSIPFLFIAGVTFGYFVVLPAAVRFFQNFNSSEFNVLVQANQYYHFAAVTLLAMGLIFQVPVGILAATRTGSSHPTRCATTVATRSSPAEPSPRSYQATRSRSYSRQSRYTCCSRQACCSPRSSNTGRKHARRACSVLDSHIDAKASQSMWAVRSSDGLADTLRRI